MIKNKVLNGRVAKPLIWLFLLGMICSNGWAQLTGFKRVDADTAVDQNKLKNEDKISKSDSINITEEYGKSIFNNNRLYLWNRTVQQKDNLSAVNTIYSSDISSTPVRDITNIIAGRLAGLYTLQSTGQSGLDASTFSIRGRTPLLVIDGVVRGFTNFNPNDIKSITVLKDATATAMYGLRGANGVINIVTKDMGESTFTLNASVQGGVITPEIRPKFLNAYDYGKLYNEAQLNDNPTAVPKYSDSLLSAYANHTNNPFLSPDVDWYNTVLKKQSQLMRYNLDMSGYGKSYHYFASLEHYRESGNFIKDPANLYNTTNSYKRYNVRLNAVVDFNKNISLQLNLFGSLVNAAEPGTGVSSLMNLIYTTPPSAYPIRNADSSYAGNTLWKNNIYAGTVKSGYLLDNERTINEDVKLNYNFQDVLPGLWASASVSINSYYYEQINRSKSFATYQFVPAVGSTPASYIKYNSDGIVGNGSYSQKNQYAQTYTNFLLGYDKSWGKNDLHLLGTYNMDNVTYQTLSQLNSIYKTAGLTAKYARDEKYLAELTLAYSGMNFYPPGKQWGFLPAASLGWMVNKESFFHVDWVNSLKVRASIGLAAWANPGYFPWLQGYVIGGNGYNIGTTAASVPGAYENGLANPNITWEKSLQWDGGVEATMLDNKLSFTLDYYRNKNYNQLITPLNTSGIFGQTYPAVNDGKTNYYGTELSLGYSNSISKFQYFIKGNFSLANSKVINLDEPNYPNSWMYRQGQPAGRSFGYQAIGFYQAGDDFINTPHIAGYTPQAGDIKYKDLNGDGQINFLDQTALGTNKPLIFYGLNVGLKIVGFDVSALLQGVANRNIYLDPTSVAMQDFSGGYGTVQSFHQNRWTPTSGNNALYPRLSLGTNINNDIASSFWMKNGSYLRLKNVEIGYSLPESILRSVHMKQVRFFVNSYNLFTWSKVKDYNIDPESQTSLFPVQKIINGGVIIKL